MNHDRPLRIKSIGSEKILELLLWTAPTKKLKITLSTPKFFCRHIQGKNGIKGIYILGINGNKGKGETCCCSQLGSVLVFASGGNQCLKHFFWHRGYLLAANLASVKKRSLLDQICTLSKPQMRASMFSSILFIQSVHLFKFTLPKKFVFYRAIKRLLLYCIQYQNSP